MTRNPEIPDGGRSGKSSNSAGWTSQKRVPASGRPSDRKPHTSENSSQPVPRKAPRPGKQPLPPPTDRPQRPAGSTAPAEGGQQIPATLPNSPSEAPKPPRPKRFLRLPTSWAFWGILVVLLSGGLGFTAVALLFNLPALPNCPAIFWPTASASLRLSCAQIAASKQTAKDLLEAIALVNGLPEDHPLRPEIDKHLEEWSREILKLGEESFQAGQLSEAIAMARKIPTGVPAYKLVDERVNRWQSIWSKAEGLYKKAEDEVRESNWTQAFRDAVQLVYIGNNYWATTKYDQLVNLIQSAREESAKLDKAFQLSKSGGLDNLLEAIKLAQAIPPSSLAYKEAQGAVTEFGRKLIDMAQEALDRKDWQTVILITSKIPESLNLQSEAQDLNDLASAQSRAQKGTVSDLEDAIALAQKLNPGRPLYDKAQDLIVRWQREIEDVAHLDRARELAKGGTVGDLSAAIAEAQLVPSTNPRSAEAKSLVNNWTSQIETVEDRPYLARADQLASLGDMSSLQEAINEASQVGQGRALYTEARRKIRQWTDKIERMQDQPYLDQATGLANAGDLSGAIAAAGQIQAGRALYGEAQGKIRRWQDRIERVQDQPYLDQAQALASSGNLPGAITAAGQIRSGRALYGEAQEKIKSWRTELRSQEILQSAYQLANPGTPEAIAQAVQTARQVRNSTRVGAEAREVINRWSYQLLAMAQDQARNDVQRAIAIAQNIPDGSSAYTDAQRAIQGWKQSLEPQSLENSPSF
ncbi:chromosome segregation ATPase [Coleofasciculus sp. FACHB-129]|uniref:chromosome segregation ATPase n=1 Tax=Cyanophyceae TaxID=3028117 RepID=UPI001689BD49|nr:chromosome segregation ATPase [Coleofasciculus sp. FACHB-129]MBD1896355.1 chromosome segregation ATPase [Coleofasciculus sp. FACHB-129]